MKEIKLYPGNHGLDCPGNGEAFDETGVRMMCLCDECDFLLCCVEENWKDACRKCGNVSCKWHP